MPLPKPKTEETKDEFIERCMSHEQMKDEYKDKDQRLAVCFSLWEKERAMESTVEKRSFQVELRASEDGNKIVGRAAVFNKWSEDLGGFREQILPGAFANALKKSDVKALWNHDSNIVLGRSKAGTLKLEEDDKGLNIEIDPPSWAGGYIETIKRGDVTEMSFAFIVAKGGDEWNDEHNKRTITEYEEIMDVSPVTYPAYPQTSVKVRALIDKVGEERAIELLTEIANAEVIDMTGDSEETREEAPTETEEQAPEGTRAEAQEEDSIKLENLRHLIEIEGGF